MKRLAVAFGLLVWLVSPPALAHPLGNFTTNVHVGLNFERRELEVRLVVDMAEIPTFRERSAIDASSDGVISPDESSQYESTACRRHGSEIGITLDGSPMKLGARSHELSFLPGEGGLQTLRLDCGYTVSLDRGAGEVTLDNRVFSDRIGWREMTVTATGVEVDTSLPVASPSALLTEYPEGGSANVSIGLIRFAPGPGASRSVPAPTLVQRLGSNLGVGWVGLLAAVGIGLGHALAPGHGKTLMAAYLVGRNGRARHAVGLGLAVALAHTIGVGVLGLVVALTTSRFRPESVYPWLSALSAVVVTGIGIVMLYRTLSARADGQLHHHRHHDDPDDHGEQHHHHPGSDHGHGHPDAAKTGPLGWRSMALLGLAGGLVPSASAVVLLLGAVSQGQPWFGLALVACFGLGMALALVGAGIVAVLAIRLGWRTVRSSRLSHRLERAVPGLAAVAVTGVGLTLLWQAARV